MSVTIPALGSIMLHSLPRNPDYPEIPAVVVSGLVQKVNEDGTVNLLTSDANGYPFGAVNLPVLQGNETPPDAFGAFVFWPAQVVPEAD
jgi:hypothetical protein